ncbi:GFA family protein [Sphingorhabdus sp. Alg231-15]|uniref:GFA family protein n=1 Tax=Sphingorhabdus sp. Alg231-15 TaxID=1922222 RepID=UPI00307BF825
MIEVAGGCHCGAVRFTAKADPEPEMLDCNCSICARTGYLHLFIPHDQFNLLKGEDDLTSYKFGSGQADHLFCSHCGIKSFYQPRSHPESYSVNYNCLDAGHDLQPNIAKFDGQNWEASKAKL